MEDSTKCDQIVSENKNRCSVHDSIFACSCLFHYENTLIQICHHQKTESFQRKILISLNIDSGYSLEPPRRGGSNEYPQSMF